MPNKSPQEEEIREIKNEAYRRAIRACELNDTVEQVIDDLKNIIRKPELYE